MLNRRLLWAAPALVPRDEIAESLWLSCLIATSYLLFVHLFSLSGCEEGAWLTNLRVICAETYCLTILVEQKRSIATARARLATSRSRCSLLSSSMAERAIVSTSPTSAR